MASDGRLLETLVVRGKWTHGRVAEARAVAAGLCEVTTRAESHARLLAKGGLATLAALLEYGDGATERLAALALGNLACTPAARAGIAGAGAVPGLVRIVGGAAAGGRPAADADARGYAAMALGNLAVAQETRAGIVAAGGVGALVGLLSGVPPAVARYAAFALGHLTRDADVRPAVEAAGAIPPLVRLAGTSGAGYARRDLRSNIGGRMRNCILESGAGLRRYSSRRWWRCAVSP